MNEIVRLCAAHNLPELDEEQKERLRRLLTGLHLVPDRYISGLLRYLICGVPPGDFLCAVIQNDLFAAVRRCDDPGLGPVHHIVHFLYEFAPALSWGRAGAVAVWRERCAVAVAA